MISQYTVRCVITTVSVFLQVFNVPVEERKYRQMNESFGETRQLQIAKEVMQKTGCTIEMSMAKDQSLSIMVTGPPRSVIQARRLILTQLQTQVCCWDRENLFIFIALGEQFICYGLICSTVDPQS